MRESVAKGWGRKNDVCGHLDKKHCALGLCTPCYHERRTISAEERRKANLKHKYAITSEQYDLMFVKQNGVCAICERPPKKKRLAVDHDHVTLRVRGLLCWWCNNRVVPRMNTVPILRRAIEYLQSDFDGREL